MTYLITTFLYNSIFYTAYARSEEAGNNITGYIVKENFITGSSNTSEIN